MKKIKIVSAQSMTKLEGLAYAQGHQEMDFMENAGTSIANITEAFVNERGLSHVVTLLVGKGNNGGDAYVAGVKLLEKGFRVRAFHLYHIDQCGPLCSEQEKRFEKAGGAVSYIHEENEVSFGNEGIILDGLVGTGFKGKAEGALADMIGKANASKLPTLSIDIPSGVCGNTGAVFGCAIQATATIYLELPKLGFFLGEGWNYVGKLLKGEFGLPSCFVEQAEPDAFLVEEQDPGFYRSLLPEMQRKRNKYEAGYVVAVGGSYKMMGAGVLSSHASLKSGAGIVRLFYPQEGESLLLGAPWELIKEPFVEEDDFVKELQRAKALIIGPGMGRDKVEEKKLKKTLSKCKIPSVIDADALFFLAKMPYLDIPAQAVLTPHTGEMHRLLEAHSFEEKDTLEGCQAFVEKKQVTLLLKGAPNILFSPKEAPLVLPFGNPGMATAGAGDVLSGVVSALLAQGLTPSSSAFFACYLHGVAGDIAAQEKTVFCMTASDILEALPAAFAKTLS